MDVITRLAALLVAFLMALEAFAPERTETLRVEHHERVPRWHRVDDYRLEFSGGRLESCLVGWSAFNALNDGDVVVVDSGRVSRSCYGIRRGDEVIRPASSYKWLLLLPIALLLAAAFGWIRFERGVDDDRRAGDGWVG